MARYVAGPRSRGIGVAHITDVLAKIMTPPLVLYAEATITYNGRASSVLARGNYLIIVKVDGSVLIHGADLVNPRNYMSAGTKLNFYGQTLECKRKQEVINIFLHTVHFQHQPLEWSDHRIRIVRTEKELQDKLVAKLDEYIPGVDFELVIPEANTDLGNCDILALDTRDTYHIVEIKRAKITTAAVVQLRKYLEALASTGKSAVGYVAAPTIIAGALSYAEKHGIKYIRVDYDTL